jgi:fructoselysine 6-kinase
MSIEQALVAIGDNCLDVYVEQDRVAVGGSALNVAAQWRALELDSAYFGAVGTDPAADLVRSGVLAAGLSDAGIDTLPGTTGVTCIRLVDRDRDFLAEDLGVGPDWNPREIETSTSEAAWCHVTGTAPEAAILSRLVAAGRRVSVDLLGRPGGGQGDLAGVEIAFTSCDGDRGEATAVAQELVAAGAGLAVVMRGPEGSLALHAGVHVEAAAAAIQPVDTCGAGDSYIAAFIAAHVEGATIPAALAAGTRSATQTCLHLGGFRQRTAPIPAWLAEQCARQIADR